MNALLKLSHQHGELQENVRKLKEAAIEAIIEYYKLSASQEPDIDKLNAAVIKSCAMQEAFSIIIGVSYVMASDILHEEATARFYGTAS